MPRAIHVDCVFTGEAALKDACVIIDGTEVLDVGRATEVLPRHSGIAIEKHAGVLLPGLVNAHTHIELSALRGRVPGGKGFVDWVEGLIGARSELDAEEESNAIASAVDDLDAFGTAAVGEVTNSLGAVRALARKKIGGCIFHEVFGLVPEHVRKRAEALETELADRIGTWPTDDLAWSPAPHTLYTTDRDVVRVLVDEARARKRRTTIHFLEHAPERRALEHGDGPAVDWLEQRVRMTRADMRWPKKPALDVAIDLGLVEPDVLLVHLCEANREELARIAKREAGVVLCPRSNLFIQAKLPPLLAVREAGIRAALGTDSLASNLSLDVLAEARSLRDRFPQVPVVELLQMATWNGARAIGRTDLGRIAKGTKPGLLLFDARSIDTVLGSKRKWLVHR